MPRKNKSDRERDPSISVSRETYEKLRKYADQKGVSVTVVEEAVRSIGWLPT
jgi:hypothetical protein